MLPKPGCRLLHAHDSNVGRPHGRQHCEGGITCTLPTHGDTCRRAEGLESAYHCTCDPYSISPIHQSHHQSFYVHRPGEQTHLDHNSAARPACIWLTTVVQGPCLRAFETSWQGRAALDPAGRLVVAQVDEVVLQLPKLLEQRPLGLVAGPGGCSHDAAGRLPACLLLALCQRCHRPQRLQP